MRSAKQFIAMLICLGLCLPAVLAQTAQQEAQSAATIAQEVTIIIQQQQVRFTAQKAVQEMRLQIFNQSGELTFDSGAVTASQINWPLQSASGETLKSGMYAYALSIKETGVETARVRRGHFIVDRARERDGSTDRLWVTSQNDSNIGTDLTVARSEEATVAGLSTSRERATDSSRANTKRDASGRVVETETRSDANENKVSAVAAGTVGQIAKFTTASEVGDSVITEQGGNIGIGTANPTAKLDVGGVIQSNQGTNSGEFRIGGSTVLSATNGNLLAINAGNFAKVSIPSGSVGIGTTNPLVNLDVVGAGLTEAAVHSIGGQAVLALNSEIGGKSQVWTMESGLFAQQGLFGIYDRTAAKARFAINTSGGVGIGTTNPLVNLDVVGSGLTEAAVHAIGGQAVLALNSELGGGSRIWTVESGLSGQAGLFGIYDRTAAKARLVINTSGNVGIGTIAPATKLHVESSGFTEMAIKSTNERAILSLSNGLNPQGYVWTLESGFGGQFPSLFGIYNRNVGKSGLEIDGNLLVSVKALQITGGADFAENFDVRGTDDSTKTGAAEIQPGMVVAIDPNQPGKLALSRRAYDRRVAGVISGAGDVKPGMMMGQAGTLADGKHPVALSGRVYAWVDATHGAIKPGDLLTTSTTPGHAMKAGNSAKAQGAVIGKAMTGLKSGKGLVLVLVTLQ